MAVNQKNDNINHKFWLTNRNDGTTTGVKDAISFDLEEIVLDTVMGIMTIKGKELHVKSINLEKGQVDFEGMVDNIVYADSKAMKKQSLMGRLFG